ncbi:MAG: hypothetical protein QOF76_1573, partial [Solirubrobacteraceae bacterium]|nr:hypothetical protein [Solirubrobacteraceae bacterium]
MSRSIVINGRAAVRPELGGVERWARELTTRLPALRPGGYTVAAPPPSLSHRAGHAWEQTALPAIARRRRLLCPANLAPLAYRRTVVVIHDAAALRNPAWYSKTYASWQAQILPRVAERAEHVVTVSEFSKAEIVDLLGVAPGNVTVIPGGVGEAFRPDAPRPQLRLRRPYVLAVASATARKNLAALAPLTDEVEVVVAGGGRPQFAAEAGLERLTRLGHVDEADLPGLYAGAEVVVVPSKHEGFGLIALEAMASGTPVVAARAGALPDTVGDAGVVTDDVVGAVRDLLSDEGE